MTSHLQPTIRRCVYGEDLASTVSQRGLNARSEPASQYKRGDPLHGVSDGKQPTDTRSNVNARYGLVVVSYLAFSEYEKGYIE